MRVIQRLSLEAAILLTVLCLQPSGCRTAALRASLRLQVAAATRGSSPAVAALVLRSLDALALCRERPQSHICDPLHLLSGSAAEVQSKSLLALRQLRPNRKSTEGHSDACSKEGYNVHVALLDVPEESARAVASALGRKWGVLGGKCANGIVAIYSTRGDVVRIAADHQVEEHLFPPVLQNYVQRASAGIFQTNADSVVASLVSQFGLVLAGKLDAGSIMHPWLGKNGLAIVIYALPCFLALSVVVLALCCAYDALAHYLHRAHFRKCLTIMQKVHNVFQSKRGEMPLCPCCVREVSLQPCPQVLVFLCGHRFHTDCANKWFLKSPDQRPQCPICETPHGFSCGETPECEVEREEFEAHRVANSTDEAKTFFLHRLHDQFPDIISRAHIRRWASIHTEAWLSEVECPKYFSIFNRGETRK